ncbi:MAG: hypothetical protein Q4G03_10960 [Planctomycetia bacterium]|nr:hypothetical protein [Planctomycetia bacterium]
MTFPKTCAVLLLSLCAITSCKSTPTVVNSKDELPRASGRSSLSRGALAPDAVVFDVLIAHTPYQELELLQELWDEADENALEPSMRQRLYEQGFRVGVIGASPPESLSKLLTLKGRQLRSTVEEEVDYSKNESLLSSVAYSKPVNLRAGMRSSIEMQADVMPSIPILERENGALVGQSYVDARPIISVAIEQESDGSVLFDLSPLLKYGAPQMTSRYQHGQLVRVQEQPTKTFDQLRFSVSLRPGQFLVVGASNAKNHSLGNYFFNDGGKDFEQTTLVIRLLVTQHDAQFDRFADFKEMIAERLNDQYDDLPTADTEQVNISFEEFDESFAPSARDGSGFDDYILDDSDVSDESEHSADADPLGLNL